MNPFKYSDTNKRYYTFSYFLKQKFGFRVVKVPLDAGFTCPNLDGTKGRGGCTYCSERGSGDFAGSPSQSLKEQLLQMKNQTAFKWPNAKYIAYFQAHTNTYAPLRVLKEKFETALSVPEIIGISIATRADCISLETADYLAELSKKTYLEVELGLQTICDNTGNRINRCHSYREFLRGYNRLHERGVNICVHIINGLPDESPAQMIATARAVGELKPHSIKIHLLHVLKGTAIANEFADNKFSCLSKEEYVNIVCDQLELLPAEIIIQRLTGDGDKNSLIAPIWSCDKRSVLNAIDKELALRNSYQSYRHTPL